MAKRTPRMISKKVRGMTCECSWDGSKQAGYERFDYCKCKVSGIKGKRDTVYDLPGEYIIGTIFIKPPPKRRR